MCFTRKVQYYEGDLYICTESNEHKFIAQTKDIFKFNSENFARFIRTLHDSMYNEHPRLFTICNLDETDSINITIHPNGFIQAGDYHSTIYCPRNCLKWGLVDLYSYTSYSYVLKRCDKKGNIITSKASEINPYSNNCRIVYNIIKENPSISTYEIIDMLQWAPNSVTSRLSELMSCSRIQTVGKTLNPHSGRLVHKWATIDS